MSQLPAEHRGKSHSFKCGYFSGKWEREKPNDTQPTNPIDTNNPAWQEWQDGFETARMEKAQ